MVKTWIAREIQAPAATEAATGEPFVQAAAATYFEAGLATLKQQLERLAAALPQMPADLLAAEQRVTAELEVSGWLRVLLFLVLFVGLGLACEQLFGRAAAPLRHRIMESPLDAPINRLRTALERLAYGVATLSAFALGSIGAFLAMAWPPGLRALLLNYLMVVMVLRLAMVLARFLFAPQHPRFRVVPMPDTAARDWYGTGIASVGWFTFGLVTIQVLRRFGTDEPTVQVLAYLLGLGLVALALRLVWRVTATLVGRFGATLAIVAIYVTWVTGLRGVMWLLIVTLLLPGALRGAKRAVAHLYRPPDSDPALGEAVDPLPADAILLDRAIRFVLFVAAILLLAWGWGIDYGALAAQDDPVARFARGALHAVVILLVADLLWKLASTTIDRRIAV